MPAAEPLITIITPVFNSSSHVEGALTSIRAQSFTNWECIVVNDGSTDDTAIKVQPFLADQRFTYVEQRNAGVAVARNTALKTARGTWVCLLDHDDRWMPTKLEDQLAFANSHAFDIVCTAAVAVTGSTRKPYSDFYDPAYVAQLEQTSSNPPADAFGLLIRHDFVVASSVMIRKSLFDQHGAFDAAVAPADDYDMWLRCMPAARIGYLPKPLIEYHIHDGNASHDFIRTLERTIQVLHSGADRSQNDPVRAKQFGDSLIHVYQTLFAELLERRQHALAWHHVAALATRGLRGLRLLRWLASRDLLRTLWTSRRGPGVARRSNFGDQ